MAEIRQWDNLDDEDPYPLYETDSLGVLSSTRKVVEQGEYAWINKDRVAAFSEQWLHQNINAADTTFPLWYEQYHFSDGTERTANWVLLLDALNFCFWAEKGQTRWRIKYQSTSGETETLDGYWAEAAALTRAVAEGIPLWDAEYLSKLSSKDLAHIFRGSPAKPVIPLFEQRLQNAREVGRVLLEKYDGQFVRAIEQAEGNAVKLTLLLAQNFPSFNDVASYRNREVPFFKRAQICVADIHGAFGGQSWGAFTHLDQLTIFADYKLPQILRHFGLIEYHPALAERIDNQILISAGSEEEVEIRAAIVWACELLRRDLARGERSITAAELDQRLWLFSQNLSDLRPYHRTRTIYY